MMAGKVALTAMAILMPLSSAYTQTRSSPQHTPSTAKPANNQLPPQADATRDRSASVSPQATVLDLNGDAIENTTDVFGPVRLHLQNRNGVNGALFEQAGIADLVDQVFKSLTQQGNFRFEARPQFSLLSAPEYQYWVGASPTLVIAGNGALLAKGSFGIGNVPQTALDLAGAFSLRGMSAPAVSPAGQGRLYFDSTAGKFMVSENGGTFVNLASGGTLTGVTPGTGLTGGGTTGNVPVAIANQGVNTAQLADNGVTSQKIASGQVVKNVNGLTDGVTLSAGSNVTITPSGNTLTIASTASGLSSVSHDATLTGNGTGGTPLGISNGGVGTAQLADGSVTQAKIAVAPLTARRAVLDQFWTTVPHYDFPLGVTSIPANAELLKSDGADIWVASLNGDVLRVRASDGLLLQTWTTPDTAFGVLVAMGRVFATAPTNFGKLYMIDPTQTAGPFTVTTVSNQLGAGSRGIAFDGNKIWTANFGTGSANTGSVSTVTPVAGAGFFTTTFTAGFNEPWGALFDGNNVWVTDVGANTLLKLNSDGTIAQTVGVGFSPQFPAFDGLNIWVPNGASNSITVVRAATGSVVTTLTGNGLAFPTQAAFDGQRILVTNQNGGSVSLWNASDMTPIGTFTTGGHPFGACSDGINFWFVVGNALARY
jgi:hypothetical protein